MLPVGKLVGIILPKEWIYTLRSSQVASYSTRLLRRPAAIQACKSARVK